MTRLDYAVIREHIPIRRVLDLLCWEPVRRRGPQWRGGCPLSCTSDSSDQLQPDFSVHLARDLFRCFRCRQSGNQLDLWIAVTGLSLYPATLDLCQRIGLKPVTLQNTQPRNRP